MTACDVAFQGGSLPTGVEMHKIVLTLPDVAWEYFIKNLTSTWQKLESVLGLVGWYVPLICTEPLNKQLIVYIAKNGSVVLATALFLLKGIFYTFAISVIGFLGWNWRVVEVTKQQTVQQSTMFKKDAVVELSTIRAAYVTAGVSTEDIDQAIVDLTGQPVGEPLTPPNGANGGFLGGFNIGDTLKFAVPAFLGIALIGALRRR